MIDLYKAIEITGGTLLHKGQYSGQLSGLSFDTRSYKGEDIFLCIKGENFDAHNYLVNLKDKEAKLILVSKNVPILNNKASYLMVADPILAASQIASFIIENFKGQVISVTGSNGKTTFQNWLYSVLNTKYKCHHPEKSFNNLLGVANTICNTPADTEILILELGTNHPGEIAQLSAIVKANIAVLLNVGMAHLANFGSLEALYKEKSSIFLNLRNPKIAIVPEDLKIDFHNSKIQKKFKCQVLKTWQNSFVIDYKGEKLEFKLSLPGEHVARLLSALAVVAEEFNFKINELIECFKKLNSISGRFKIQNGFNNSLIIDDCYNANPHSVVNLINSLADEYSDQFKILILGDLAEIDGYYEMAAEIILDSRLNELDAIFLLGDFGKFLISKLDQKKSQFINDFDALENSVKKLITSNSVVAFKASRLAKLEKLLTRFQLH